MSGIQNPSPPTVQDEGATQGTADTLNFTGAGVTATVVGSTATINIPGGGSGGGGTGTVVLDFGAAPGKNIASTVVIGQAGIIAGSNVNLFKMGEVTARHNAYEHAMVPLQLSGGTIVPGTGFTATAMCLVTKLTGTFNIRFEWS